MYIIISFVYGIDLNVDSKLIGGLTEYNLNFSWVAKSGRKYFLSSLYHGGENFSPFIFGTSIIDDDDIKDPIRHKFLRVIRESKEGDYMDEFVEFKSKVLEYIGGFGESDTLLGLKKSIRESTSGFYLLESSS